MPIRIALINPNTTAAMTQTAAVAARASVGPDTEILAITNSMGPVSIESHYDEALAIPGLLATIRELEASPTPPDGYIISCFGDPGLDAARELTTAPVVAIAQAAFHAAALLSRSFVVVTTLERTAGRARDLVRHYGFADACTSVRGSEIPVLELETNPDAYPRLLAACRDALSADDPDAVVLGCAGMAGFTDRLRTELGVPVIDGAAAAAGLVESLVRQGLRRSGRGEFAAPIPKPYVGKLAGFALR